MSNALTGKYLLVDYDTMYRLVHIIEQINNDFYIAEYLPVENKKIYEDFKGVKPRMIFGSKNIFEAEDLYVFDNLEDLKKWEGYMNGSSSQATGNVVQFKVVNEESED